VKLTNSYFSRLLLLLVPLAGALNAQAQTTNPELTNVQLLQAIVDMQATSLHVILMLAATILFVVVVVAAFAVYLLHLSQKRDATEKNEATPQLPESSEQNRSGILGITGMPPSPAKPVEEALLNPDINQLRAMAKKKKVTKVPVRLQHASGGEIFNAVVEFQADGTALVRFPDHGDRYTGWGKRFEILKLLAQQNSGSPQQVAAQPSLQVVASSN
jgi:hypothetical protein